MSSQCIAGRKILFDVDSQTNDEIMERLVKTVGKTRETLEEEAIASEKKDNPANFGKDAERFCICSIPGQLPCPGVIPLPKPWRGKHHFNLGRNSMPSVPMKRLYCHHVVKVIHSPTKMKFTNGTEITLRTAMTNEEKVGNIIFGFCYSFSKHTVGSCQSSKQIQIRVSQSAMPPKYLCFWSLYLLLLLSR